MRTAIQDAIVVSVILTLGWNCSTEKPPVERGHLSADVIKKPLPTTREYPSSDAAAYYFPADVGAFLRKWYSQHLKAMQEPSLFCGRETAEFTYRFLWLRTFDHPICVRIEKEGSSTKLHAVELDGRGGYAPGKPLRQIDRTLSSAEQERMITALKKTWYWGTPRYIVGGGLDGAEWILEGAEDGKYQVMKETSPRVSLHRDACLVFLELAGFSIPAGEMY
jgi:hypothetical protein